jgi:hypothetical protein
MSKAIRSYPYGERITVANIRINNKTMGLGYWAAVDYFNKLNKMPQNSK